jgi:hypothetical protein
MTSSPSTRQWRGRLLFESAHGQWNYPTCPSNAHQPGDQRGLAQSNFSEAHRLMWRCGAVYCASWHTRISKPRDIRSRDNFNWHDRHEDWSWNAPPLAWDPGRMRKANPLRESKEFWTAQPPWNFNSNHIPGRSWDVWVQRMGRVSLGLTYPNRVNFCMV